ncbi:MAG: nitronate monooxygenase family protein [Steroidobacteraceae bacterium]
MAAVARQALSTRITELLGIDYPILQGGMRWVARAPLAAAVANAGGIGFISAHTQPTAAALAAELRRARELTSGPIGVNLTILPALAGFDYEGYLSAILEGGVTAVETAGANPAKYIERLKVAGIKVIHKCTSVRYALKAEQLGADAVSIDGFECAGHPGGDDVPGLVLIPIAATALRIPVLACGGVADGRGLVAALALGAEGINMGTRFMLTEESPVPEALKQRLAQLSERDTVLVGRSYGDPSRLVRNTVATEALAREQQGGVTHKDLLPLLGAERWMGALERGDFEGGAIPGGLSIGLIKDVPSCAELIGRIVTQAQEIITHRLRPAVGL